MSDSTLKSVEIIRTGGQVPTYTPTHRVDTRDLPDQDRRTLEALITKLDLARLPDRFKGAPVPDAFNYELTVTAGGTTRTIEFHDGDGHPPSLDDLADWLKQHGSSR